MENNQIIDADLANSHFNISDRAVSILKAVGLLAIVLGIFYLIQVLTSIVGIVQQFSFFTSIPDDNFKYYFIANILYNILDVGLSIVTAIFLFGLGSLAGQMDRNRSQMKDWNRLFQSIKNVILVFFFQLLLSLGFRIVYFLLNFLI